MIHRVTAACTEPLWRVGALDFGAQVPLNLSAAVLLAQTHNHCQVNNLRQNLSIAYAKSFANLSFVS
jgi:hypothetical protein